MGINLAHSPCGQNLEEMCVIYFQILVGTPWANHSFIFVHKNGADEDSILGNVRFSLSHFPHV